MNADEIRAITKGRTGTLVTWFMDFDNDTHSQRRCAYYDSGVHGLDGLPERGLAALDAKGDEYTLTERGIDRFNDHRICRDGWNADEDFDPAPSFRWAWAQHVRKFRERAACPHCGGPARIRTGANPAVGCPRCGLWAGDVHYDGATVIGLVEAWNRFAEKEGNDGIF